MVMTRYVILVSIVVASFFATNVEASSFAEDYPLISKALGAILSNPGILEGALGKLGRPDLADNVTRVLERILEAENNYPSQKKYCQACKAVFPLARPLFTNSTWLDVRDFVVSVCTVLVDRTTEPGFRTQELCVPMMDMYGPHVLSILTEETVRAVTVCESLNVCFHRGGHRWRRHAHVARRSTLQEDVPITHTQTGPKMLADMSIRDSGTDITDDIGGSNNTSSDDVGASNGTSTDDGSDEATSEDVIRFVHLADIHVDPLYTVGSAVDCDLPTCCRATSNGTGYAGEIATLNCNLPQRTLEAFLRQVAQIQHKPHFAIYTGDNPPHHQWDNETQESQLECTDIVMTSLGRELPDMNVFCAIGNHESHPTNLYYLGKDEHQMPGIFELNNKLADYWSSLANITEEQVENIRSAAYYSAQTGVPGLRTIVVNSNLWYAMNFYNILAHGSSEMQQMQDFIARELEDAREQHDKVIMTIHHPPGMADFVTRYSQWYSEIMARYSDVIVMHVAGHTHDDDFKVFKNEAGEPVDVLFIAPSVTTRTSDGAVNPSARVYDLDAKTFEVVNYHQYRMTITPNATEVPPLEYVYSAKDLYNLPDMSARSYADLIDRLETDEQLYDIFDSNYRSNVTRGECDEECKAGRLCAHRHTSYDEVYACVRQSIASPSTAAAVPSTQASPTVTSADTTMESKNGAAHVTYTSGIVASILVTFTSIFMLSS